jgi:hypothetical protein
MTRMGDLEQIDLPGGLDRRGSIVAHSERKRRYDVFGHKRPMGCI